MKPRFTEAASADLRQARAFYGKTRREARIGFNRELRSAVALLRDHPEMGKPAGRTAREFVMDVYPYSVIYYVEKDEGRDCGAVSSQPRSPNSGTSALIPSDDRSTEAPAQRHDEADRPPIGESGSKQARRGFLSSNGLHYSKALLVNHESFDEIMALWDAEIARRMDEYDKGERKAFRLRPCWQRCARFIKNGPRNATPPIPDTFRRIKDQPLRLPQATSSFYS